MKIHIVSTQINKEITSPNKPKQYISESDGMNFQTPFYGAELIIDPNLVRIQSNNPIDGLTSFTTFIFEDKHIGCSSFPAKLCGSNLTIKIDGDVYKGVLEEEFTKLSK